MSEYEITRRLRSLPGCQTTSYLILTHINKSTCRFVASFLKIAAAVNVIKYNIRKRTQSTSYLVVGCQRV